MWKSLCCSFAWLEYLAFVYHFSVVHLSLNVLHRNAVATNRNLSPPVAMYRFLKASTELSSELNLELKCHCCSQRVWWVWRWRCCMTSLHVCAADLTCRVQLMHRAGVSLSHCLKQTSLIRSQQQSKLESTCDTGLYSNSLYWMTEVEFCLGRGIGEWSASWELASWEVVRNCQTRQESRGSYRSDAVEIFWN